MTQHIVATNFRVPDRQAQLEAFQLWAMTRVESRYAPRHELVLVDADWALRNKPLTK